MGIGVGVGVLIIVVIVIAIAVVVKKRQKVALRPEEHPSLVSWPERPNRSVSRTGSVVLPPITRHQKELTEPII